MRKRSCVDCIILEVVRECFTGISERRARAERWRVLRRRTLQRLGLSCRWNWSTIGRNAGNVARRSVKATKCRSVRVRRVSGNRMGAQKKKKSTGGGMNSLQREKCVRAVANYHLRFSNELAGHGAGLQHCCPFHVQHRFPSLTPMLVVAND